MHIQEGSLKVALEANRDTSVMVPGVVARAKLICPVCDHETDKKTPYRNLSTPNGSQPVALDRLDDILNMVVTQFCNGRTQCDECGTVGGLPKSTNGDLKEELASMITRKWLNRQLDQLTKETRTDLQISEGIMRAAKRTVANLRGDRPVLRAV